MHSDKKNLIHRNDPAWHKAFKLMLGKLFYQQEQSSLFSLLVTSSLSDEGSTTIASCLARNMAIDYAKDVLLVDANLEQPALRKIFDLPGGPGLSDYILDEHPLDKCIQRTSIPLLSVMGKGSATISSLALENANSIRTLIEQVRDRFSFLVIDSPPVLESPETALIARYFDGTILVIQAHKTSQPTVVKAKNEISNLGGNLIGIVLNRKKKITTPRLLRKHLGDDFGY
ncbi:tyrosine-protein kinase family protein [Acidobacteriota bacterium]